MHQLVGDGLAHLWSTSCDIKGMKKAITIPTLGSHPAWSSKRDRVRWVFFMYKITIPVACRSFLFLGEECSGCLCNGRFFCFGSCKLCRIDTMLPMSLYFLNIVEQLGSSLAAFGKHLREIVSECLDPSTYIDLFEASNKHTDRHLIKCRQMQPSQCMISLWTVPHTPYQH